MMDKRNRIFSLYFILLLPGLFLLPLLSSAHYHINQNPEQSSASVYYSCPICDLQSTLAGSFLVNAPLIIISILSFSFPLLSYLFIEEEEGETLFIRAPPF
ncbi:hypothetical protein H5T87_01890 [bacterium]|nr:hypothetical protein [bacterium]